MTAQDQAGHAAISSAPAHEAASSGALAWAARSPLAYLLILVFGLALYLPGLRSIPAVDRDEARFAQASRQMLESGDFVAEPFKQFFHCASVRNYTAPVINRADHRFLWSAR